MLFKKTLALFLTLLIISGCTAVQNNELAKVDKIPDVTMYQNKPSVYVELHAFRGEPTDENPRSLPYDKDEAYEFVKKTIDDTNLFSSVTFDPTKKMDQDYTITLKVYNHGNEALAMISGFITGFSFFIIPGAATDNYTLQVSAMSNTNKVETMIQNKDSITTWVGVWFVPFMGNTIQEATHNTLENQIRDSLKQLFDKDVLEYSKNKLLIQKEMIES